MRAVPEQTTVAEFGSEWRVSWSAVWIGALSALAAALVFGLIGTALGASAQPISSWHTIAFAQVAGVVCAGFFSLALGGWAAGKVSGIRYAEPAILHAVVAWLLTIPAMFLLLAAGAGTAFGGWYAGFVTSPFAAPVTPAPDVVRNTALAGLTVLLVGLAGAVIGGWIASGEPMSLGLHRTRKPLYSNPKGTAL
jgi:hypothetical protein